MGITKCMMIIKMLLTKPCNSIFMRNKINVELYSKLLKAETHCAVLHSALSLGPAFALPSHEKAVCSASNPWHTMLSLQAALCVCRSNATILSESHLQRG